MLEPRAQKLAAFIRANLLQVPDAPIDLDTSLIDNGSLDSMGATLLAAFIEEQFGARLREDDLAAERIETIRKILHLVDEALGKPSR